MENVKEVMEALPKEENVMVKKNKYIASHE
jgi:hypothetical protein